MKKINSQINILIIFKIRKKKVVFQSYFLNARLLEKVKIIEVKIIKHIE